MPKTNSEPMKTTVSTEVKMTAQQVSLAANTPINELDNKIRTQGDKVRQLKADKAPKVEEFLFNFNFDLYILSPKSQQSVTQYCIKASKFLLGCHVFKNNYIYLMGNLQQIFFFFLCTVRVFFVLIDRYF